MSKIFTPWHTDADDRTSIVLGAQFVDELGRDDLFGVVIMPSIDEVHRVDLVFPGLLVPTVPGNNVAVLGRERPFDEHGAWGGVAERFGKALYSAGHLDDLAADRFSIRGCVFSFFGGLAGALRFSGPARDQFAYGVLSALEVSVRCPVQVNLTEPVRTTAYRRT